MVEDPSPEVLAAIAQRHRVPVERIVPVASGEANRVYLLGDELVLRIPRTVDFVADLCKEARVIPVARRAGIRTPAVITFDDTRSLLDVPYMVVERVRGVDLAQVELPLHRTARALRELGRELAKLHAVTAATVGDLLGVPVDAGGGDPREVVARLATEGYIDTESARWLSGWFDRLEERSPAAAPRVLLHGDVALRNVLVDDGTGQLRGLIDWGDVAWADPAMEFAKLPLEHVSFVLEGYREESGAALGTDDASWEARAIWYHLSWGLAGLASPGERHWNAPAANRLLGVIRFLADRPPEPWSSLS